MRFDDHNGGTAHSTVSKMIYAMPFDIVQVLVQIVPDVLSRGGPTGLVGR